MYTLCVYHIVSVCTRKTAESNITVCEYRGKYLIETRIDRGPIGEIIPFVLFIHTQLSVEFHLVSI
jgi:hypothetical protein